MGKINIADIPGLIKEAIASFYKLPISDYCNLASTNILKIGYLILGILCVTEICYAIWGMKRKAESSLMMLFLGSVFPVAVNFIVIMCPESHIYTIMVLGMVVVLFVPIVLYDVLSKNNIKNALQNIVFKRIPIIILAVIICRDRKSVV